MPLKNVDDHHGEFPMERTAFRTSWTQPEGAFAAFVHEARIIDVNLTNWTVDCATVFDQKRYFDIQVASPYLHPNVGEGIYAVPEVGCKCLVCIPSDGPPPFVLAFIMPVETRADTATDQAPDGTGGGNISDSTFGGGRPAPKLGDIYMRGRDGNFVILHRGGVLQIGSTELAQRIYIPLSNLVTDISQNYNHFNTAGAINWGIRPGSPDENPECDYRQTFRVFANDEFADVRLSIGQEHNPALEPAGDDGATSDMEQLGVNTDNNINVEFLVAPGGFDSTSSTFGDGIDSRDVTKFRFVIDRGGNVMMRSEGSVVVRVKEKLRVRVDGDVEIFSDDGNMTLQSKGLMRLQGGDALELATDGGVVKLNGGSKPVASVGSQINIVTTVPIPILVSAPAPGTPGVISAGAVFNGMVTTGNPTILV
jgi:hypothetical protein